MLREKSKAKKFLKTKGKQQYSPKLVANINICVQIIIAFNFPCKRKMISLFFLMQKSLNSILYSLIANESYLYWQRI